KIVFPRRHARPFQIKRMSLREIERIRIASKRDGDPLEMRGVLSARRLPRLLFDVFNVYFLHAFLPFRPKWRNLLLFLFNSRLTSEIVRDVSTSLDMTIFYSSPSKYSVFFPFTITSFIP